MAFFCIHCKSEIDPKFKACPFCGEVMTDFLRRHLETPIDGKYQILSRLGVGGMGEVYKVLHIHLNAIRVIKLMRTQLASDPGANERFIREARLATRIQHPNVAAVFDFSSLEDGSHYMVWEYIEGINLHELIDQRGPLSPRYAAKLAVQALMGLDAIHRAGIVHRDVSPENLMITREATENDERVKIIDLGIAKSFGKDDDKTKTGMFVGKWKYCSPEHLGMLPAGERIDGRADIYSFGIVLYEMLTGVPPFQADTPHAYLMMHSQQRPKALRESNPYTAAPRELEALLFRALEKDRNERFASAREFAQALEQIVERLPDTGGAPPPLPANAEVTDEATRITPKPGAVQLDAETVLTDAKTHISDRILIPEPVALSETPAKSRAPIAIAAVLATIIAGAGWMFLRQKPVAVPAPATVTKAAIVPPVQPSAPPVMQPGYLAINAFPWANVTEIRSLDNGATVNVGAPLVTPAPVQLPAGRYEVTLANPNFSNPITREIAIAPGSDATLTVHFTDPASAALPDFGGAR